MSDPVFHHIYQQNNGFVFQSCGDGFKSENLPAQCLIN